MKVFISWSGTRSHAVAAELGPWLKKLIPSIEYFLSSDMERGVKWLAEIGKKLDDRSIGILCVTPGNVNAPWLNFEAGALSKQINDEGRVIPYLLDFRSPSDLKEPLGQFNASLADEEGTLDLLRTLNLRSEHPRNEQDIDDLFAAFWNPLEKRLDEIRSMVRVKNPTRRSVDEKVDDLLELVRIINRQNDVAETHSRDLVRAAKTLSEQARRMARSQIPVQQPQIYHDHYGDTESEQEQPMFSVADPVTEFNAATKLLSNVIRDILADLGLAQREMQIAYIQGALVLVRCGADVTPEICFQMRNQLAQQVGGSRRFLFFRSGEFLASPHEPTPSERGILARLST